MRCHLVRLMLSLAVVALSACDDGGGDPPDTGPVGDGAVLDMGMGGEGGAGGAGAAGGEGGQGGAGGVAGAPLFFIAEPGMDEVLAGRARVRVETDDDRVAGIVVRVADLELGRDEFAGDALTVGLDFETLPDGDQQLTVDAIDADGAVLGTRTVDVRIMVDPPNAAAIDDRGGALQTPNGVIVIVPPGAVDEVTRLRVVDLALDDLPDVVGDRPLEILQAIDLLPMQGPKDPSFRFARPARILFPVEDTDNAQQVGSAPFAGNIDDGELRFVSTVNVGGGWAATGGGGGTVTGVANLSRPGEPLQPLDLIELRGEGFPTKPMDLKVRLDGRAPISTIVGPRGRTARFVIPTDVTGDPVDIELLSRKDARRQIISVTVVPRDEPLPEIDVADARIAMLFDGLDMQIEQFQNADYADADVPQVSEVAAMRDQIRGSLGMPIGEWRLAFAEARADAMALSPAERQQIGAALAGLEENLAAIGAAGPLLLTQDEACLSLLIMDAFLQYFGFVTGIIPDWTPPGLVKSALLQTAMAIVDYTAKSVGCDEDDDDDDEGIWGHECDLLIRAEEANQTASVNGDVIGYGPRSPGGLGISIGGQSPFDVFVNTLFYIENIRINLFDPETGEPVAMITDVTDVDGTFTIPFVTPDATVDAVLTLPDGTQITIPISTPGDGESAYIPIFIPAPDYEQPPVADDFGFTPRIGDAVGLRSDAETGVPAVADFDDDGLLDVYFPDGQATFGAEFFIRYLGRNLGGGLFQALEYGPFPRAVREGQNQLHSIAVDVDGDGDLDLIGPAAGPNGFNVQVATDDGFAPGAVVRSPAGEVVCGAPTGMVVGDFVAGDGPDVVIYSLPSDIGGADEVDGARCVFANQGDGTFVQTRADALRAFGHEGGSVGSAADLDGDGHLDAYFELLGVIAFGDGAGGFDDVRAPDNCWRRNLSVADVFTTAPAIFDADRDGDLDLVQGPKGLFDGMSPEFVQVPACLLRNDGGRVFTGVPTAAFDHPDADGECRAVTCTQFSAGDVNADGFVDLMMYHLNTGLQVAYGGANGFTAGPVRATDDGVAAGLAAGDLDGDGQLDFAVGSRDAPDYVLINTGEDGGNSATVDLRDASGAPGGLGAYVQVDLDGDGDFETGPQAGLVGKAGAVHLGLGAAEMASVRVHFVDRGAPGGNVVEVVVSAGESAQVVDPQ